MQLIVWIVMDYLIDLFNRSSRDYREVSRKLAEMKSKDKIIQHERLRVETTAEPVSEILFLNVHYSYILVFDSQYR